MEAATTANFFLQSNHKRVANSKEVEEDDSTSDGKKRERDIADWIGRPCKPPSINKDEEAEGEEEDIGAAQASTEYNSPIDEYEKDCEYNQEDDHKYTRLLNEKNTKEEASSRHKGESSSDSLDSDKKR